MKKLNNENKTVGASIARPEYAKTKNRNVVCTGLLLKGDPKAITLIALVITIIILIILSSVGIYLTLGNNGILNKAKEAKNETLKQAATEKINLKITNMQIEIYGQEQRMPTLQEFSDGLCEDDEIQYVELQSKKVGSLEKVEVGNASSIFTKLKEYPYEFEINSSLQLASIDGVKIASENVKKIVQIYNTSTSTVGEYTMNDSVNNYDFIVVIGNSQGSKGYNFIISETINEMPIRVGITDGNEKCMNINFQDNKLIITNNWNYKIDSIYGINL